MRLTRYQLPDDRPRAGILEDRTLIPIENSLSDWLHGPPGLLDQARRGAPLPLGSVRLLPPVDQQEVWAAGVTYKRSKEARQVESEGASRFYDLVYRAPRPELFLKATSRRVLGPDEPLRVRSDSRWTVPEPELTLVIAPDRRLVGFTIGNDMSARDIEGENPLYLPQAKIYTGSCSLGPAITLAEAMPPRAEVEISIRIERGGQCEFEGKTSVDRMARTFEELIDWLFKDNSFPDGVLLMTGTGIVPPDDLHLEVGDVVHICIDGIGELRNPIGPVPEKPLFTVP